MIHLGLSYHDNAQVDRQMVSLELALLETCINLDYFLQMLQVTGAHFCLDCFGETCQNGTIEQFVNTINKAFMIKTCFE